MVLKKIFDSNDLYCYETIGGCYSMEKLSDFILCFYDHVATNLKTISSSLAIMLLIPQVVYAGIKFDKQPIDLKAGDLKAEQKPQKDKAILTGEIFLQPGFAFEGQFNQFQLFPSSAYLSLEKSNYSTHILFAEDRPFLKNILSKNLSQKDYGLQSFFIQADWSAYGRLRIGQIPLSYGLEGGVRDSQLRLPRSLLFPLIPHYDLGLSYLINYHGFYVEAAVHNGYFQRHNLSTPTSLDTLWWRAKGGWKGSHVIDVGLSAIIGKSRTQQEIWPNYALQLGNIYMELEIPQFVIKTEFHFGELFIDQNKAFISSWHVDLEYPFIGSSSLFVRWNQLYIDHNIISMSSQQKVTLGALIQHKQSTFSIYYESPFTLTQRDQVRLVLAYQLLLSHSK